MGPVPSGGYEKVYNFFRKNWQVPALGAGGVADYALLHDNTQLLWPVTALWLVLAASYAISKVDSTYKKLMRDGQNERF